jgi:response regulator RpfG family c-di-GMP phosphodiesterase
MSNHQLNALLLSDGRPSIAKALHRALKSHTLLEANTAEQALQLFRDNAREIDLMLADVTLETSAGIQVALILRSEIPDLPVILTSTLPVGRWNDRDSSDLRRLGWRSLAILQEPVPAKMLTNTVLELIGSARGEFSENSAPGA